MSYTDEFDRVDGRAARRGPSGLLVLAIMAVGMLAGMLFLIWLGTPRTQPAVGQVVSKLDLSPLLYAERPFTVEDLQGKVTVMHFWGTWCPPCREEFPEFVKVVKLFEGNDQVQFVSISSSQGPEYNIDQLEQETREFLQRYETTVPTYADRAGLSRYQIAMLMPDGSLPYPSTFVIDRRGAIAGVWIGFSLQGMEEVAAKINSLL